jgi:hypothetical protein
LQNFDFRQFWEKRLRLFAVDKRRLGRLIRNRANKTRRSTSKEQRGGPRVAINLDGRTGEVHVRSHDTVQELIDDLSPTIRVHRALVPISNEIFLPNCGVLEGSSLYM